MELYGMEQSKVSCNLGKLNEAVLVGEEPLGKWSFYSLHGESARQLLAETAGELGVLVTQGSSW